MSDGSDYKKAAHYRKSVEFINKSLYWLVIFEEKTYGSMVFFVDNQENLLQQ